MVARLIALCVRHRLVVAFLTLVVAALGVWGARKVRLDALPDLSDVQVIVVTDFPGQAPQVVDDQITTPLSSALLAVPGATDVRGVSMFEISFVYVLFEDGTDLYWARSRVLETLSSARDRLPAAASPRLGPDATGVGWVYQYALVPGWYSPDHPRGLWHDVEQERWYAAREDAPADQREHLARVRAFDAPGTCPLSGRTLLPAAEDLAALRTLQDWYLRYPLNAVPGVAEIASIGGFVRQYSVIVDPLRLAALRLPVGMIAEAIERSNADVGGSVLELSEAEYLVRSRGYVQGVQDLERVPVGVGPGGAPLLLRDVATIEISGEARRGVGELDGRGEAVGGIVVARFGEDVHRVLRDVKLRMAELEEGLPPGVFVRTTYDRSALIDRAVDTLSEALIEQLLITAAICLLFLAHVRSAFVAVIVLPIGLLTALLVMRLLGINANIMSLGGLALAIGVMVDSGVVMIENAHRHLEIDAKRGANAKGRVASILEAAQEVGPSLFFSLLVITVSFLPIFVLGGEAGRLFSPLAWTKTFAIAAGALLGITIVPVLMVWLIRGRIPHEDSNPLNRWSQKLYEPAFHWVLRHPWATLAITIALGASTLWPASRLGSEFMPPLDEGDLLYMPTTEPSLSIGKARELLQQTDRQIAAVPEVKSVHGKIGRAETATDPAPLSMLETVIQLEPDRSKWRTRTEARFHDDWPAWLAWPFEHTFWPRGRPITTEELVHGWHDADGTQHAGLDQRCKFPGLANSWTHPIETRLAMLSTGIKTPIGIKVFGTDLASIEAIAADVAAVVQRVPGTASAYAEPVLAGRYLDIDVDREKAARHGLAIGDVQDLVRTAIGGMPVSTTLQGVERYPIQIRFARELRDDPERLAELPVTTPSGAAIPLSDLATIRIEPGAPMVRSEAGRRAAWIFVDIAGRDLGGWMKEARERVAAEVVLPAGTTLSWTGAFEELERTNARLAIVVPLTLALIILLLYASNGSWFRVGVIALAVPFSLIGAVWFLWWLDYDMSVAVWVGIIALLGIDAETGQIMLLYLDEAHDRWKAEGRLRTVQDLMGAIHEGAVKRIRPKTMTVATDMIGLMPLLWASGTGADLTRRLVAPLVGGIAVSFLMELLVYPVLYYLAKRRSLPG
ncbi:MAG: efflux RND transporter permease subunit [Planctomycetota bacterium]|nr:efflux RND transporter permease subunit [Planctomycetota bacterium]